MERSRNSLIPSARSLLVRTALFAAGWWVLAEGHLHGWLLMGVIFVAGLLTSFAMVPAGAWRIAPLGLLRFVPYFLQQSILGGIDVARRALDPQLPLEPGFIDFPFRLPEGPARPFFAATLSLLPGTVSAEIGSDQIRIHVLDLSGPVRERLRELEEYVAAVFGSELAVKDSSRAAPR